MILSDKVFLSVIRVIFDNDFERFEHRKSSKYARIERFSDGRFGGNLTGSRLSLVSSKQANPLRQPSVARLKKNPECGSAPVRTIFSTSGVSPGRFQRP